MCSAMCEQMSIFDQQNFRTDDEVYGGHLLVNLTVFFNRSSAISLAMGLAEYWGWGMISAISSSVGVAPSFTVWFRSRSPKRTVVLKIRQYYGEKMKRRRPRECRWLTVGHFRYFWRSERRWWSNFSKLTSLRTWIRYLPKSWWYCGIRGRPSMANHLYKIIFFC